MSGARLLQRPLSRAAAAGADDSRPSAVGRGRAHPARDMGEPDSATRNVAFFADHVDWRCMVTPTDLVQWAFPDQVHQMWSNAEMEQVRQMIVARPLAPEEEYSAGQIRALAQRVATHSYLRYSYDLGLFKGREGRELLARLRANDPHSHRGAMAECVAAWWLGSVLRYELVPRPRGVGGKVLEFEIPRRSPIFVEVKAPYRPMRFESGEVFIKDPMDTDHMGAIVTCLGDAHQQFHPEGVNLVVLVPSLDWPLRPAVIRALEEERGLAIDAVMVLETMHDYINPTERRPGRAFLMHRCYVVTNRHRKPPGNSFWRRWPVYEGPDFEIWKKLRPVYGTEKKQWVRLPSASFEGRVLVPVPI